ncbi:MAG: hypothetical protein [Wendovervirus sonii]|uniref:Tail tape measure protein n=1 Tax=phage Lak_Megaphage_Sonny TaxID=3109229 RepID=A0ABZ0Z7A8_9CAUD|nr:MAG: hypothetical protein [phage Lak_Megaphage_Sonny]
MAANSTNNILKQILIELDSMKSAQKVTASSASQSNVPKSNIGNINVSNAKNVNDTLANFATSMTILKGISKKDVDNVVNMIDIIGSTFSKIKIKKEDISGLNDALVAFGKMHTLIDKVSCNFLKMVVKYNPAKGRLAGWSLGGFYKNFIKGFEKRLSIKELTENFKGENIGANLSGFSTVLQTLMSFNWKQLLKIGIAWKMFPDSAGKNIANFLRPIINVIKKMPAALANEKKSIGMFGTSSSEKTYVTNPQISGFIEVMSALTSVTLGQIIKLSIMGHTLNGKKGQNIGNFFSSFVKAATKHGVDKSKAAADVVKSISKMFISLSLSLVLITATVAIAGWDKTLIALGILTGMVIGSVGIIKLLSNNAIKKSAKESLYTTGSLIMLYTSLTLNLLILTAMVKNNKPEHITGGFIILTVLTLSSVWLIKQLGDKKIGAASKTSIKSVATILLLMTGMTGIALIATAIGKNGTDSLFGSAIVVGLAFAGMELLKILSKIKTAKLKQSILSIATITLIMLAMSGIALIATVIGKNGVDALIGSTLVIGLALAGYGLIKILSKITKAKLKNGVLSALGIAVTFYILSKALQNIADAMKILDNVGAKGIIVGIGLMTAMTFAGIKLVKHLSKVNRAKLIKGIIAAEGIGIVMLTINKSLQLFGKFLESVHKVTGKDIAIGSAIMVGMVTAVGAACFAMGGLVMGPQAALYLAGVAALEGLALVIASLSGAMLVFSKMIHTISTNLTEKSITDATNVIIGKGSNRGMVGCILDIVKGLSKIGVWASVKIGIISRNLNPLFFGLSRFCDVIQKMATMKMLDHYDEKGKPHYVPLKPEDFTKAAVNLSISFATFLKELNNAFVDGPAAAKMFLVIKAITKGGVVELMKSLSFFTDSIIKLVGLQVPDEWDKNGKVTHYKKVTKEDFKKAAVNIATAFSTFLIELKNRLGLQAATINWVVKHLMGNGKNNMLLLMKAVKESVTPLATFSSGRISVNGKIFKTDLKTLMDGAKAMVIPISFVLRKISNLYYVISKRRIKYVCEAIQLFNKKMKNVGEFYKNVNNLVEGSDALFKWLNNTVIDSRKMQLYGRSLTYLGNSLKKNKFQFNSASKSIFNIARAIKKLDDAIINRNADRIKAINMMTESFKHLNDNIGTLNRELAKSMQLANQFNQMKEANDKNFIINAVSYVGKVTKDVGEKVEKIQNKNEKAEAANNRQPSGKQSANIQNINIESITMAIIEGLNKWNAEHKDLTLELSGRGAIALGTLYGNK